MLSFDVCERIEEYDSWVLRAVYHLTTDIY